MRHSNKLHLVHLILTILIRVLQVNGHHLLVQPAILGRHQVENLQVVFLHGRCDEDVVVPEVGQHGFSDSLHPRLERIFQILHTLGEGKLSLQYLLLEVILDGGVLLWKIHQIQQLQQVHHWPESQVLAVQLPAVEVENHLLHHGLGVGQLDPAGLALSKVVVSREHAPEVLRSHPQHRLVGQDLPTIRADDLDITELRVLVMGGQVLGELLLVVQLLGHGWFLDDLTLVAWCSVFTLTQFLFLWKTLTDCDPRCENFLKECSGNTS